MEIKFIAEVGSNWEGDIELGKKHILNSKESGADFVKFQMWRPEDLYSKDNPYWKFIYNAQLTFDKAKKLKEYADHVGIGWSCSVFYPEAVDLMESLNVPFYKIASRTSTLKDKFSIETIKKVGETKRRCFISTGEGGDKGKMLSLFKYIKPEFTYCVSNYPTKDAEIDWNQLLNYNFFSDHTLGITIPLVYVILMTQKNTNEIFVEKHVKLPQNRGPDASFAITYDELKDLTSNVKRISKLKFTNG